MVPQSYFDEANARGVAIQKVLDEKAGQIPIGASGIVALDWMNGNRSILQDADLTGMIMGMTLSTKAEEVYRALIEATAFGTRVIMEAFKEYNVPINKIFACGGLAHKSPVLMQIYADVVNAPITVTAVKQTSALSAAIFAAIAVGEADGGYDTFEEAVATWYSPPSVFTPPLPKMLKSTTVFTRCTALCTTIWALPTAP
jgi:L-ribulokinase